MPQTTSEFCHVNVISPRRLISHVRNAAIPNPIVKPTIRPNNMRIHPTCSLVLDIFILWNGREGEIRTHGLLLPKQADWAGLSYFPLIECLI